MLRDQHIQEFLLHNKDRLHEQIVELPIEVLLDHFQPQAK